MQRLTQEKHSTTVRDTLLQLRQSLAGVDLFAPPMHDPFAAQTEALADTVDTIPEAERQVLLLHALNEAIAAIELAARLADKVHGTPTAVYDHSAAQQALDAAEAGSQIGQTSDSTEDPLLAAYRAFAESQPMYQELYHYRNALAERQRSAATGKIEA